MTNWLESGLPCWYNKDKNPPATSRDMGSIPGKAPHAVQQLSPYTITTETQVPRACALRMGSHHNEKPVRRN